MVRGFNRVLLGFCALLAMAMSQAVRASVLLRAEQGYFRDSQGRLVFLRGVNVSSEAKVAPFSPLGGLNASETSVAALLDPLPCWGFNAIRLLLIWDAYEPEPGRYNEAYLDQLARVADAAWERGLYVIVDMHQDAFSRYLANGCGEGFPAWAVPSRYRRAYSRANAGRCGPLWALGRAFSPDMHRSFRDFYADAFGARSAFLALWARVARRFSSHPGVVGYDILNEPWGREGAELAPLYRDAASVIRGEDPSAILFVEPQVLLTAFGLRQTRLPRPDFGNFAYAPHFYDPLAASTNSWAYWRAGITRHGFCLMTAKAREWQAPLFVGEFGVQGASRNARAFSDFQYDELDYGFLSGAQWNYTPAWSAARRDGWNSEDLSIVDDRGELRANFRPRPYVQKLAGAPVSQRALRDRDGALVGYELSWEQWPAVGAETEVFVPSGLLAPIGTYALDWSGPGLSCAADPSLSRVRCRAPGGGLMRLRISR